MDIQRRIDTQEKTLARMLDWVKAADSKAQFTVALDLAIIGGISSQTVDAAHLQVLPIHIGATSWLWKAICCALPFASLCCCLLVAIPRVKRLKKWMGNKPTKPGQRFTPPSLLFFGTIAEFSADEHAKRIMDGTDESYLADLIDQIHINSGIAHYKYRLIKYGMRLLALSVIPWLFFATYIYR